MCASDRESVHGPVGFLNGGPPKLNPSMSLRLNEFSVMCRLGCSTQEQATPQEVRVSLNLEFARQPVACVSDRLEDTVCYARLCEIVRERATAKNYSTVEHL